MTTSLQSSVKASVPEAVLLFVATFSFYYCFLATGIQESDGGELAVSAVRWQVAHQPGYPLYLSFLHLWFGITQNFFSTVYEDLSALSALFQSLASATLYLVLRNFGVSRLLSFTAIVSYIFFASSIKVATDIEVFAFHDLIVALFLLAIFCQLRWKWFLVGVLWSIGATHHQTIIFWAPLLLWQGKREFTSTCLLQFIFGSLLGLLPYALLLTFNDALVGVAPHSLSPLLGALLRVQYGTFAAAGGVTTQSFAHLIVFLREQFFEYPLSILGLAAFLLAVVKGRAAQPVLMLVVLAHLWFLSQLGFPISAETWTHRFYSVAALPFVLSTTVWLGNEAERISKRNAFLLPVMCAGSLLVVVCALPHNLHRYAGRYQKLAEAKVTAVLKYAPQDSLLLLASDPLAMGVRYAQQILNQRTDLQVVIPGPLVDARYRLKVYETLSLRDQFSVSKFHDWHDFAIAAVDQGTRDVFIEPFLAIPSGLSTANFGFLSELIPGTEERKISTEKNLRSVLLQSCTDAPQLFNQVKVSADPNVLPDFKATFLDPLCTAAPDLFTADELNVNQNRLCSRDLLARANTCRDLSKNASIDSN